MQPVRCMWSGNAIGLFLGLWRCTGCKVRAAAEVLLCRRARQVIARWDVSGCRGAGGSASAVAQKA